MKQTLMLGIAVCAFYSLTANAATSQKADDLIMPPRYIQLGTWDTNSVLDMKCEGRKPYSKFKCKFLKVIVTTMTDKEKKQRESERAQLDKATPEDIDILRKSYHQVIEAKGRFDKATPEQQVYFNDFVSLAKNIAEAKDVTLLKATLSKLDQMEEDTCKISTTYWEADFVRAGKLKWITNAEAEGLCNVVTVQILELRPGSSNLWKYTNTIASADTGQSFCSYLKPGINKPYVYSWEAPKTFAPGCKYFEFH